MVISILVTIGVFAVGGMLAFAITGHRERTGIDRLLASLAWGPGLAAGLLSLVSFFGLDLGLGHIGRAGLMAVLALALLFALWAMKRARSAPPSWCSDEQRGGLGVWSGVVALALLAVGYGWASLRWFECRPLGSFDGMGIWTYRALQWFRSGEAFPETLGMMLESKPGYPLLLPGLVSSQFTLCGGESTIVPIATGWFFVISVAAVCILAVKRWASLPIALAAAALLLSTPLVWRWAFAQCADLALASFTLVAAYGLFEIGPSNQRETTPSWLVGFFLGLMVWTKDEGLFLAIILVAVAVLSGRLGSGWLSNRGTFGLAVGALPGIVALGVLKIAWVSSVEAQRYLDAGFWSRLTDSGRWRSVAVAFSERLVPWSGEGLWGGTLVVLFAVSIVVGWRYRKNGAGLGAAVYGVPVVLAAGFFAVAYLLTPEPLVWHLRTSLDRLLLQLLPLAVVAVFAAFGSSHPANEQSRVD